MEGRPHVIMYTRNTVKALVRLEACRFPSFPKACGGHPGCRGFNERRGVEWAAQAENVRVLTPPGRPKLLSADTRQRDDPCYHTHASLPGEPRGRYAWISDGTDGKKKKLPASSMSLEAWAGGRCIAAWRRGYGGISRMQPAHGASGCFSAAPCVVWGGLCNRVSLQSQRVPLLHGDERDSLHGGRMRKHRARLWNHGFSLDAVPSIWIFKPSESQKGRLQIIIGCVFIVFLHWS